MVIINTIVIDDEPFALSLLADYCKKTEFINLVGEFDNPIEAIEFVGENKDVDLIVTDIQMPDLTGIEMMKSLQTAPKLIFTTAYEEYALEGYKVNAVDYLLKPFSFSEFLTAVQKVKDILELEQKADATNSVEANNEFLFCKSEYKILRVNFNDILYIEGLKDYVKIYTSLDKPPVLTLNSIKALEQKLPSDMFMRVHRSFIVNLKKIEVIERSRIVFGSKYIPVSELYKVKFQEYLNKNFL